MEPTGPTGSVEATGMETGPTGMEATGPTGMEATGPTGMEATGPTGIEATGPTGMEATGPTGMEATGPAPEPPLSIEDLLNEQVMKLQKEQADRQLLESISAQSAQALKPTLLQWAMRGFPAAYPIMSLPIQPPNVCADGEVRGLSDYISYVSGKTIEEHVCEMCCKLKGMVVSFTNLGGVLTLVVSRE